jgi:hypothetical protein
MKCALHIAYACTAGRAHLFGQQEVPEMPKEQRGEKQHDVRIRRVDARVLHVEA